MENVFERLEKAVEETVRRTLFRLRVPRREELLEVSARLDRIATRIDRLEAGRAAGDRVE